MVGLSVCHDRDRLHCKTAEPMPFAVGLHGVGRKNLGGVPVHRISYGKRHLGETCSHHPELVPAVFAPTERVIGELPCCLRIKTAWSLRLVAIGPVWFGRSTYRVTADSWSLAGMTQARKRKKEKHEEQCSSLWQAAHCKHYHSSTPQGLNAATVRFVAIITVATCLYCCFRFWAKVRLVQAVGVLDTVFCLFAELLHAMKMRDSDNSQLCFLLWPSFWTTSFDPTCNHVRPIGNESVPIQLAQCWFPQLAISNAKI